MSLFAREVLATVLSHEPVTLLASYSIFPDLELVCIGSLTLIFADKEVTDEDDHQNRRDA